MATSLQERLKLKQYQVDTWTPREQLCLASAVMRSGDQNWVAVSRTIKTLTTETNRPLDWYSTKNCALMYAKLLEKVDAPKRKRERGEPTNTNVETPGEIVTKMLAKQRIEELRVLEAQSRTSYNHLRQQIQHLEAGMLDHTLDAEWEAFVRERKEEEEKERLHREWLKQREEKIHAIQKALKHQIPKVPISTSSSSSLKKVAGRQSWPSSSSSERRDSGMSDNSELDLALDSPGISSPMVEESQQSETETKPVPTSPLLSSLLSKPPNPPNSSNVATDLRNSFNLASSRGRVGLSPNVSSALQNLVSSAISGTNATLKDHQKNTTTSPGSAAPTLSRLLELPPRPPGDPMPSITDLPPTHAETMAQVHKGSSPPELKKPKLDIEALAAEAAESLLSDTLLNDLDDQLDDEVMDEEEERKKEEELSSVSVTPPETGSQEGGKTRDHQSLGMSEADVKSSSKLLGGKADPQKCSEGSSPEATADVPLEEDKKGEENEQVGDKRQEEKEVEKQKSTDTQHVEQELLDKEKVNEKEREEFYKIKKVVVEITDIMKDKKIENMVKKTESYNNEEKRDEILKDMNIETKNEMENNNPIEEQKGEKYNAQCAEKSTDENLNKVEYVENDNTEKDGRKIEGSHKRKSEEKEGERYKRKRNDKKKDKKNYKEHKKAKKNKKYKHREKIEESEKDESEKEYKDKERRSDKEKSKDKKGEKEKNKVKEKYKENRSEREKHKDKKEVENDDAYQQVNKHDKDEIIGEKKHDKNKSKHESEKSQIKGDDEISKAESDKEKENEECSDQYKERNSKSIKITDFQEETDKNEMLDKTKIAEVEKEMGNCNENVKESEKLEIQDRNQSNKLCDKNVEKDLSKLDDNRNDTSAIVKTENVESSSFVSYADKVKTPKKTNETNITEDQMDCKENNKEVEIICKDIAAEVTIDSKNVEEQESISMDVEMESKENNCNVNNMDNTGNVKQKSYKIQIMKQNDSNENMKVLDSSIKPINEEKLNKSSEVKENSNSNQEQAASGDKDGDMTDKLDDMNLKERKKKMSGGFGKADVFPAEDSPMDDSEHAEDIKEAVILETTDVKHSGGSRGRPKKTSTSAAPTEDMDDDSMDASKNKKEQEDLSVTIIKRSSTEERKTNIEVKQEKSETDLNSLNISVSLKKEGNEVHENKNKKDEKEKKEAELEEILAKIDYEDKESQDEEKRGKKKKKGVYLEDEYINEDSRDALSEEDLLHVRGGKRKSSGSDLFAVASPFIPESNPCSPASTHYGDENDAEKAYRAWKKPIMILWNEIAAHKYASVFLRPITDEMAPGYHDVVHRPMDLKTIKTRIENGTITNTSEFQRDIMLMFLNATMYNTSDHNVYQMATRMMKDTVSSIEEFRATQMLARASDTPVKSLRRHKQFRAS